MDFFQTILSRNAEYAQNGFSPDLKIIPSRRTLILACVDPRVDPMDVLKLEAGEAAIIRNVGGRVNPSLIDTLDILRTVSKAGGNEIGIGWTLLLLQHTDCGIRGCLHHAPGKLAAYMGVPEEGLSALAVEDPYKAIEYDIAALRANADMPADLTIAGVVYDVKTGRIDTVAPPVLLKGPS
jgi:carbonic anhydrase